MNIIYVPNKRPNPIYKELGGVLEVRGKLFNFIHGHDSILVTDLTPVTKELVEKSPSLRIVASLTTGTDHICTEYLAQRGIRLVTLLDCPKYITITGTAEHALGLMIALARNYKAAFDHPQYSRDALRGHELSGKTLGIIGLGRIGKKMRDFGFVLGMNVTFFDPFVEEQEGQKTKWEAIACSDFVTLHAPLNAGTTGMITGEDLATMKKTAYLINTARGELIQKGALLHAVSNGIIAGAASDFYDGDLLAFAESHDNLILTPHLGGATHEGLEKADALIAEKLKDILHEQKGQETNKTG